MQDFLLVHVLSPVNTMAEGKKLFAIVKVTARAHMIKI